MKETQLLFEAVATFAGTYPEIPLAPGVNYEALVEDDPKPMFMTLPIGKIGAESRNGRRYNESHVRAIYDAIVERKAGGIRGHLRSENRPYDSPPITHKWVGAKFEGNMLWGKAYILPHAVEMREEVRVAKATNSDVATSIYGTATPVGESDEFDDMDLYVETIDYIAVANRAGIPDTESIPMVTAESTTPQIDPSIPSTPDNGSATSRGDDSEVKETQALANRLNTAINRMVNDDMSRTDIVNKLADEAGIEPSTVNQILNNSIEQPPVERLQAFASVLNLSFDQLRRDAGYETSDDDNMETQIPMTEPTTISEAEVEKRIEEARTADRAMIAELNGTITQLKKQLADFKPVMALLENPEYPVVALQAKIDTIESLQRENALLLESDIKAQVAKVVKTEAVRPMIESMVTMEKPDTRASVVAALNKVRNKPEVKALLKAQVQETMGPNQSTPQSTPADAETFESDVDANLEVFWG